jgi:uncharacterized RDD family membrane protein YckC
VEKIKVATSFNIELEFEAAAFYKRFLAWLTDLAVVYGYLLIVSEIIARLNINVVITNPYDWSAISLIIWVPFLLYHLLCELFLNGQSIGKKIFRIKVISEDGNRPELHQLLLRWLMRFVDMLITLGLGALISSLVTPKNQRLGDLAAGTLVINADTKAFISESVFKEVNEGYVPLYPAIMKLNDRDISMIKNILDTVRRSHNYDLANRTAERIKAVTGITEVYEYDSMDFMETLLKDYNYLAVEH